MTPEISALSPNRSTMMYQPSSPTVQAEEELLDKYHNLPYYRVYRSYFDCEATTGFEPANEGFADLCLKRKLPRRKRWGSLRGVKLSAFSI